MSVEIVAVRGLAMVQDAGRPGRMHDGVPPGGALIPELLAEANRAVGNPWGAAAIEVFGELVASVGGRELLVASAPLRAAYLAVRGGIDAPEILGGRGALLVAGIGRPLRPGDGFDSDGAAGSPSFQHDGMIRVILGPDQDRARLDCAQEFTVSRVGDRTGIRLHGPAAARDVRDDVASAPMVRGAIQVPPSGEAIVLGPDHPTTGGYPVAATVIRADQGRLFARPPGARVRFAAVDLAEARRAWIAHSARYFFF